MRDEHRAGWNALEASVLRGPGELPQDVRAAASRGSHSDADAQALLQLLHEDAAAIGDGHVRALVEAGWSDDAVLELVIAGAVGAGLATVRTAEAALETATADAMCD